MRAAAFLLLLVLTIAPVAAGQTVSISINTFQTAAISPYIYGINGTSLGNYNNPTFERTGGNRITAYNWTNNYSNAGNDYYYENDNYYSNSTAAGAGMAAAIDPAMSAGAGIVVGVPINGYVAKDDLGGSADVRYYPGTTTFDPNWLSDRFVPELPSKSLAGAGAFTLTPSPSSSVVYEDEFVNWVKTEYPQGFTTNTTTPIWFELDNEPDIWTSTHPEIRPIVPGSVTASNPLGTPQPLTYAELISKSTSYAMAIKAVAPNAKIFGPVSYGWEGYTSLQEAPDSGADGDFLTYYLNQMAAASQAAGIRLVDALDLHWYSEVTSNGILITNADSGYSGSTLTALQAARVQAPRSLWDPTYVENSWITADSTNGQAIQLLPREQAKINATAATYGSKYTANQISISEYNYGGGDDISGGIAEADVLGIFGQQGVLSANEWQLNSNESFIGGAFQMYRNYDGKGGAFGDISISTTAGNLANASSASVYASDYSTNSARMTLVAINKTTGNLTEQLALPNAPDGKQFTTAAIYELTAASSTPQFVENIAITNAASFSYTMPGYSVTTIALSAASISQWATAISGSWSTSGNWTGGVPNGVGAVAEINAATTASLTVALDEPATLGMLLLGNSASATAGYSLSGTGSNTLTFNNGGNGAAITVTGGTHAINAPIVLADNLQVNGANTGWTLSFGTAGINSTGHTLTMSGNGSLVLSGQNNIATINADAGATTVNGGTIGTFNYNAGAGGGSIGAGTTITAVNVNSGGITLSGGTIGSFNHDTGAGTSTIGLTASVGTISVNAGTVNFNSTQASGTLTLPGGSTGTVIVGPPSGGRRPRVATADFSLTPATGTVNAANPLAITGTLKLPGGESATISNGSSFTAAGANLANIATPSTLGLSGGTLTFPTGAAPQSIGVHWSSYAGSFSSTISGTDGYVPQSHWTNLAANWYSGGASNLVNSSGSATAVAVTSNLPTSNGTYWYALGHQAGVDNLLVGPGGGNGSGGGSGAIPNAITGIPYASYEIIAYLNNYNNAGGAYSVWLDGNPASSSPTYTPAAGSRYYYGATYTNSAGFVLMTNNSNENTYTDANTVVWTGLSGSSQTLWTEGWSSTGANDNNANEGITGFQIVATTAPEYVDLPATSISATSSSTLDFGETGTPSQYHTLGSLSLTAGTGTRLQLQHGLNINFNGISAIYPVGGSGAELASIAGGAAAPAISLASSSSVSVDPNVTLTIASPIGNPQTGVTTLTKIGAGTLVLSGTNSYTGGTLVESGTLIAMNPSVIASGTELIVGSAAAKFDLAAAAMQTSSAAVPEPATLALLGVGAVALLGYGWRRRNNRLL